MLSFWCPVMVVTKKLDGFKKKWIWGQKTAFLTKNSAFFYATPMKPPFFWLGRSRLNGMTTPPYPEVTLDTFGFPVGAHLATRRAVLWPQKCSSGRATGRMSALCQLRVTQTQATGQ